MVLGRQEQVGNGWPGKEASRGEACVQGRTCAPEDGAHYLRARLNSSFCQNGELKQAISYAVVFEAEEVDLRQNGLG